MGWQGWGLVMAHNAVEDLQLQASSATLYADFVIATRSGMAAGLWFRTVGAK